MTRVDRLPDGQLHILSVGERRFRLLAAPHVMPDGYLVGEVQIAAEETAQGVREDLLSEVKHEFTRYQEATLALSGHVQPAAPGELPGDPIKLSYRVAATLFVDPHERQHLLEEDDVVKRLEQELALLKREMPRTIGPFSLN